MRKKIIILIIILVICLGLALGGFLIYKNNSKQAKPDLYIERAKELVKNNYTLSYLLYGNVKTDDSYTIDDNEKYYLVNDKEIENIKTINDIIILIEQTLKSNFRATFINYLTSETANNYLESNGKLYVKLLDNPCKDITRDNENNIKYQFEDDKMIIQESNLIYATKENDDYYLTGLVIGCTTNGFILN